MAVAVDGPLCVRVSLLCALCSVSLRRAARTPMRDRVTIPILQQKKRRGEKIAMITCYDYPSAVLLDSAARVLDVRLGD